MLTAQLHRKEDHIASFLPSVLTRQTLTSTPTHSHSVTPSFPAWIELASSKASAQALQVSARPLVPLRVSHATGPRRPRLQRRRRVGVWPPWPVVLCVALAATWVVSLLVLLLCCQGRSGEGEAGDVEARPLDDLEAGMAVEPSIGGLR